MNMTVLLSWGQIPWPKWKRFSKSGACSTVTGTEMRTSMRSFVTWIILCPFHYSTRGDLSCFILPSDAFSSELSVFLLLNLLIHCQSTNEPPDDKTNKMVCAPSEDSNQPGHPPSLIRVFAVRAMGSWGSNVSSCGQRRLWSDWRMPRLIWVFAGRTGHFVGFVMRRRKSYNGLILLEKKIKYISAVLS